MSLSSAQADAGGAALQRPNHPGFTAGRKWFVMQTKLHHEARAIRHLALRAADVDTFLPRIEVVRKKWGRHVRSLEVLFPSYLFFQMDLTPATWSAVRWTPGVRRVLGDGDRPIGVPDEFIEAIKERVRPLGFVRVGSRLNPGAQVRVRTGPFAGLEGIIERPTSRRDRVRVLLQVVGRVTPIEIEIFDLERL